MVSLASSDLCKLICRAQFSIKLVTLFLSAPILPIGTEWMSKSCFCKLIKQSLFRPQLAKQLLACLVPVNTSMLLTRPGNALYSPERCSLVLESLENNIYGFQPHSHGSVDCSRFLLDKDTFLDSIFGKICIEVSLGLVQDFQIRCYNNCYESIVSCVVTSTCSRGPTLQLLS
jgi:hypothetical protein